MSEPDTPGLSAVLAALEPAEGGWRTAVPAGWMQGRTAYGGFSAALALHAAMAEEPDLPPLRSAQIAFVGPLAGAVTVRAERLRRGRNAAWVAAEVAGADGVGLRATFVFMAPLASAIDLDTAGRADPGDPDAAEPIVRVAGLPAFLAQFDLARGPRTDHPAEWVRWVRLRDHRALDPAVALFAVADCLPPAALRLAKAMMPISSMTWQIDLLAQPAETTGDSGWRLLGATTDHARAGASSQRMMIWAPDGRLLAQGMQSVALFA